MKKLLLVFVLLFFTVEGQARGGYSTSRASAYGKYNTLRQVLVCPKDRQSYGRYKDYGYWAGGRWCGQYGKAGYWVWSAPKWYVWARKGAKRSTRGRTSTRRASATSAYGKYRNLRQKLKCSRDRRTYGSYKDYGYWRGGRWCGQYGKAGYWVWVSPYWYVWGSKRY